jgi:hypothetical protein
VPEYPWQKVGYLIQQRQMLVRKQSKQKMYYDKSVKFLKPLKTNEKVHIRKDDIWVIGHVVRKCNDRSYLVKEDGSDAILRRNRYFLKPYFVNNSGYTLKVSQIFIMWKVKHNGNHIIGLRRM